jgi:hypothetical protein
MCFINSGVQAYFSQRESNFTLENSHSRKYSFQKLDQLSLGNNVLDAPTSNTDGFLLSDTCVSSS